MFSVRRGAGADVVRRRVSRGRERTAPAAAHRGAEKIMGRVPWAPWQRFVMGLAARTAPAWRDATLLVQPATILRWHRAGLRAFWRRRSRPPGRPLRRAPAASAIALPTGKNLHF